MIGELKQAGFTDEEISEYMDRQKETLRLAGFSEQEINAHFGIKDRVDFNQPTTPEKADKRAKDVLAIADKLELPISDVEDNYEPMQIQAWNPTLWEKIKHWFYTPPPPGGWDRSDRPFRTLGKMAIVQSADAISGLALYAPDVLTYALTKEPSLAEYLEDAVNLERTSKEERAGKAASYITSLYTSLRLVGPLINKIPARVALRMILSAGVQFGVRGAIEETAEKITKDDPIDWQQIWAEAGWGTLFGAAEVGVGKLIKLKQYRDFVRERPEFKKFPKRLLLRMDEAVRDAQSGMPKKQWMKIYKKDAQEFIDLMRENFGTGVEKAKPLALPAKIAEPTVIVPETEQIIKDFYKTANRTIYKPQMPISKVMDYTGINNPEEAAVTHNKIIAQMLADKKLRGLIDIKGNLQLRNAQKGDGGLQNIPDNATPEMRDRYNNWKKRVDDIQSAPPAVPEAPAKPTVTAPKEDYIVSLLKDEKQRLLNEMEEYKGDKVGGKSVINVKDYKKRIAEIDKDLEHRQIVSKAGIEAPAKPTVTAPETIKLIKPPMDYVKASKNLNGKYEVKYQGGESPEFPATGNKFTGEFDTAKIARSSFKAWWYKQQTSPAEPTGVYIEHIKNPKMPSGKVITPIPESVQEAAKKAGEKIAEAGKNIKEDFDQLRFYPKAPPEFRNAVRTDMIGALTKAKTNVYETAQKAIWEDLDEKVVEESVEIIFAKDQLSRAKLEIGNPEISVEEAQKILDNIIGKASDKAIEAAERWSQTKQTYTDKLVERGVLRKDQLIEDHVRHYVEDYTPEWAPYANIPTQLKRPFRGYTKKAVGTTKEYRQDKEALLDSLLEMEYHNLVEDFVETQVAKYDIKKALGKKKLAKQAGKPYLSKAERANLFGTTESGRIRTPRPGRIYDIGGKRYRAYTPDIPFSRAIYLTENGEAALGNYKNVALIPEEMYNLFRDFSQRGSRGIYLVNRATSLWKSMAILSHFPSFNINNFVGDTWIALIQHPDPLSFLKEIETSLKYLTGKLDFEYAEQLDDFIKKHDIKQTFTTTELILARKSRNPLYWLLNKSYKLSDFRESIMRVAYASSMLRAQQAGEGEAMVAAHDWINTKGLSTGDALGKISREILTDYAAVSKPFRRYVSGGVAPFGTFYFKTSARIWKWFGKHPLKALLAFMALPIASTLYNNRRDDIQEMESKLPDYVRNRTHFVLGRNPDGTTRVLSLQLPQDVLIGTKIFSIVTDYSNRVIHGEMTPKEAAIETLKTWGIKEVEGVAYLMNPWIRFYQGLASENRKDPYDKAPIYRRDVMTMDWDEKLIDRTLYFVKCSIPFLGATIQTYEKGLPVDIALKKYIDTLAGKGAIGIYDMNPKGEIVLEVDGKKRSINWQTVGKMHLIESKEMKYLGNMEDDFVASGLSPLEFIKAEQAEKQFVKIYNMWSKFDSRFDKKVDKKIKTSFVKKSIPERISNRLLDPSTLQKWYRVRLERAKTDEEKKVLAEQYQEIQKQSIIKAIKGMPRTAKELVIMNELKDSELPWDIMIQLR